MIKEFKQFITRGNVMQLAVGIIIGASFNKIVQSLVNDIITPIISLILGFFTIGDFSFEAWSITMRGGAELRIGMFLTYTLDFLITAFVIFMIVKMFNKLNEAADKVIKKTKNGKIETETETQNDGDLNLGERMSRKVRNGDLSYRRHYRVQAFGVNMRGNRRN